MSDVLHALSAEAAAAISGGSAYDYRAEGALAARMLVVEQGGTVFPPRDGIGSAGGDVTGRWGDVLEGAGVRPGMFSWWNAVPCGLSRPTTVQDKAEGRVFLKRAVDAHDGLIVIVAVGSVAQGVVRSAATGLRVFDTRSPLRCSASQRQGILDVFVEARLYAYPMSLTRG